MSIPLIMHVSNELYNSPTKSNWDPYKLSSKYRIYCMSLPKPNTIQ